MLEKLIAESKRPLTRLHALCTLDGMDALKSEIVQQALADAHPGVRRHAIRLCEPLLAKSPELGQAIVKLADDADPQTRMQAAYTLGEWDAAEAGQALGEMAVRDAGDPFLTAAVMSSVNKKNLNGVLVAVLASRKKNAPAAVLMENLLRMADGLNDAKSLTTLLKAVG